MLGSGASADPALLRLPVQSVPLRILYEKYGPCLTQDNIIKVVALLTEYETGDVVLAMRDVYIQNPEIKIRVRARPREGRSQGAGLGQSQHAGACTALPGGSVPFTRRF